jgi:hypothetical protein
MADDENTTQANPGSGDGDGPPRETTSGRYVSRQDDAAKGDDDDKDKEEPEGKKRWLLLLLLLLLILLLLICAGAAYMRWWNKDDPAATPSPTAAATTSAPQPSATPTATATASASPSASPSPTATVRTVAMPNVVGMQASQAKTVLEAAGLTNIKFVDEAKPNDSLTILASFVVTKQSVAPGTQVPVDTEVTITCATSSNGKG